MTTYTGKYQKKTSGTTVRCPYLMIPLAFFLVECFAFAYLPASSAAQTAWPLYFGAFWALLLGSILRLLPGKGSRIGFALVYGAAIIYSIGQTGYYLLFAEMMWLSEFRYAAEGKDYIDVILSYPVSWYLWIIGLIVLGALLVWKYPRFQHPVLPRICSGVLAVICLLGLLRLPQRVFEKDSTIRYAKSDYGRMQSAEAAYENMFNPHRLYQVCGLFHMAARDLGSNILYPMTPAYSRARDTAVERIEAYFSSEQDFHENAMTGLLKDKNVIIVLMESMDDWMIGDHTPTIRTLMAEGINFTNFYTPPYGGIRTFNTEFCINTGSFLSSSGGFAFDYTHWSHNQSLASLLTAEGYSARVFHYNDPSFYSRDVFAEAMGYEDYVYYLDYLGEYSKKEQKQLLYDELILLTDPQLRQEFFREEEKTLNFIITRSAHLSYKYNEVLSNWALRKYPEYRGLTGNEETDCALVKARLVDDLFRELLSALEEEGTLQDTVIVGVTDHYTYGYKNEKALLELSGVGEKLWLEKTPCFIWSPGLSPMEVTKTLNTADFLPTVLNLLGVQSPWDYIGHDAFDENYEGYALFSDGSWISGETAYDASSGKYLYREERIPAVTKQMQEKMSDLSEEFTAINNLILETDYYRQE